jgi:tripartite-type tricarboxylate transporter receptor subunit TctC
MRVGYKSIINRVLIAASLVATSNAFAQSEGDFYAGKTITLVIGSGEAGIYDLGARIMARYLRQYIPGNPVIVPRNMPGASSVVATAYVYNVAPRDGLTIATVQPTVVLNKNLDPSAKYQPEKLNWIGRVQPVDLVGLTWTASGVTKFSDAQRTKTIVSASGAAGTSAIVPWALNRLAGSKFEVVRGYESQRPQFLAMERGEVAGVGSAALSDVLQNSEWMNNRRVTILYSISQRRSKLAPDVPAIVELTTDPTAKQVLGLLGSVADIGQTLMAPADIPAARLDILRKAFEEMVKDPQFIQEASQIGMNVDPMTGDALAALVTAVSTAPAEVVDKLREVTRPQ